MKRTTVIVSTLFMVTAQAVSIETPNWVNQVDTILASVHNMHDMCIRDTELYKGLSGTLEAMFHDFDHRDAERKILFETIRCKFNELTNQLVLVESVHMAEKDLRIRDLESKILAIRYETQLEIDRLNDMVTKLDEELDSTREAYITLVDLDEKKAEALISELLLIKQTYASMVDSRVVFLAAMDRFIKRTRAHLMQCSTDTKELVAKITNAEPVGSINVMSDNS